MLHVVITSAITGSNSSTGSLKLRFTMFGLCIDCFAVTWIGMHMISALHAKPAMAAQTSTVEGRPHAQQARSTKQIAINTDSVSIA